MSPVTTSWKSVQNINYFQQIPFSHDNYYFELGACTGVDIFLSVGIKIHITYVTRNELQVVLCSYCHQYP